MIDLAWLEQLDIKVVSIVGFGALAFIGFILTMKWVFVSAFGMAGSMGCAHSYRQASQAANQFIDKLNTARNKIGLLEPYTAEYVHVFQTAGWVHIISIFESLGMAEVELDRRIRAREYDSAVALAEFLCSHDPAVADEYISRDGFQFVSLVMWEKQLMENLIVLLEQLHQAAENMQGIGVVRKRERQPTLMTVDAIKKEIMQLREEWHSPD